MVLGVTPNLPGDQLYTTLRSVSCPAIGDCIAVGHEDLQAATATGGVLIEQLRNGSWHLDGVPRFRKNAYERRLWGVSCPSAGSCVAVGTSSSAPFSKTLIEVFSHGKWTADFKCVPAHRFFLVKRRLHIWLLVRHGRRGLDQARRIDRGFRPVASGRWAVEVGYKGQAGEEEAHVIVRHPPCTAKTSSRPSVAWPVAVRPSGGATRTAPGGVLRRLRRHVPLRLPPPGASGAHHHQRRGPGAGLQPGRERPSHSQGDRAREDSLPQPERRRGRQQCDRPAAAAPPGSQLRARPAALGPHRPRDARQLGRAVHLGARGHPPSRARRRTAFAPSRLNASQACPRRRKRASRLQRCAR